MGQKFSSNFVLDLMLQTLINSSELNDMHPKNWEGTRSSGILTHLAVSDIQPLSLALPSYSLYSYCQIGTGYNAVSGKFVSKKRNENERYRNTNNTNNNNNKNNNNAVKE